MNRAIFASSAVVLLLVACGGSNVPVGTNQTDQQLQTKKDGTATGNGTTCSWAGTALFETVKASKPGVPVPTYNLDEEFKSIDGCNECTCAAKGIMCTVKTCDPPKACSAEAKQCADGSAVGRTGPNCEFAPCPGEAVCTDDAKKCPDGSYVGRTGASCEFKCPGDVACERDAKVCPDGTTVGRSGPSCEFKCPDVTACSADAKQCWDGSYVGRTGPSCEFKCPAASCEQLSTAAAKQLQDAVEAGRACNEDAECVDVARSADCTDTCSARTNKTKVAEIEAIKNNLNGSAGVCADFKKQGCVLTRPACAPFPGPPKCIDKKCQ